MGVRTCRGKLIVDTYWPDGRRTRLLCVDPEQANNLDLRIRASRVDGTWKEFRKKLEAVEADGITFSQAKATYLQQYVKHKNRDKKSKPSRLAILERVLRNPALTSIDLAMVTRYVGSREDEVSSRTINRDLAVLRHFLGWAKKMGLIPSNPMVEWDKLSEEPFDHERPHEWIIDEVFAKLEPTVVPLFTFIRWTGCRREEALSLKWPQVDLRNKVVHFIRTKSGKSRSVPLPQQAVDAILAMPRTPRTNYVFYHPVSLTRWREAKDPWNKAREAAGHEWLRIHDLRHAYAIRLVEEGVPIEVVSEMLGHHSIDFTKEIYAKYSPSWAGRVVLAALEGGKREGEIGTKQAQAKNA